LITVVHDGESRVVQFSHFSVKEFLTSDRLAAAAGDISFHHIDLEPAHTILAQACLGVLLRLDNSPRKTCIQRFPLAEYAAQHWVDHALFGNVPLRIKYGMFDPDKPHFSRWIQIHDMDRNFQISDDETHLVCPDAVPLYYAALCGLRDVVEKLISEHPEHISARGGSSGTVLHAASSQNHLKVVQSLLKHHADVNVLAQWGWTPLHVASDLGHLDIGRCLLEHGAIVNAKVHHDDHVTPLDLVAENGHLEFARMLLRHNADVNIQDGTKYTPLRSALDSGHIDVARLLLDHGADPNESGGVQSAPLHHASYRGKLEVARLLLERGADVDAKDGKGRTAYQIAMEMGYDEIAQLLSGHGVENKA